MPRGANPTTPPRPGPRTNFRESGPQGNYPAINQSGGGVEIFDQLNCGPVAFLSEIYVTFFTLRDRSLLFGW